jgi:hypothetical protein
MANIEEAYNLFKTNNNKLLPSIEYFFMQKVLHEEGEIIDDNLNRINTKKKIIHNYLCLDIPTHDTINISNQLVEECKSYNIDIYGDKGYIYKGKIEPYNNSILNLMIPIKNDKQFFINVKINDNNKQYINFITVPKKYLNNDIDDNLSVN